MSTMNPRAGDTVTSTKPTTTTTTSITTSTTGVRRFRRKTEFRPETIISTKARSTAPARKRRQQAEPDLLLQVSSASNPRPEVNLIHTAPSPEKSRRRAESTGCGDQRAKSRIGDFFSSLASRIRGGGSKNADMGNHAIVESQRVDKNDQVQKLANEEENEAHVVQNVCIDFNKRRKIEIDESREECPILNNEQSKFILGDVNTIKTNTCENRLEEKYDINVTITDNLEENYEANDCDKVEKIPNPSVLKSSSFVISNSLLSEQDEVVSDEYLHLHDVKGSNSIGEITDKCISNDLLIEDKANQEDGNEIIDMCKNVITTMCEKIQNEAQSEQCKQSGNPVKEDLNMLKEPSDKNQPLLIVESCSASQETIIIESEISDTATIRECPTTEVVTKMNVRPINPRSSSRSPRRDDTARLRKTIQWLEEGARRMREDLASARSELHEERRAAKLIRRDLDAAIREARSSEAAKYTGVISELKARLSQSPSRATMDSLPSLSKTDHLKDENHRREVSVLKKRLAEAETTIQKLKTYSLDRGRNKKQNKEDEKVKFVNADVRKLQVEIQNLRAANKKLEEKLHIAEESARVRAAELRVQHEAHEAELSALQKALRSDTIKMIDEIQSKNREIEKLEKLVSESAQINQKLRTKEDETMRKLRETERSQLQIRLAPRIEDKIRHDDRVVDLCKVECEDTEEAMTELDRLRELAVEQQEVIEVLRQAVKEKERKLEQLSNKRRKEEFYKQWLELEPVAEVEDEDEHHQQEEGDSALSSAPSSLSPQPGSGRGSGITREAYENVLYEIEELQTKLLEEQRELGHARSQVRELEKALLQETRGSQNSRRALSQKLRVVEEREASLAAEIAELREQNELLEFRVLELEESPNPRDTPDPADSGIVSPEPIHLYKDHQSNKHRDRAIATVIPYTSTYTHSSVLTTDPQKAPLSLQESGIFEEDEAEEEEEEGRVDACKIELASQSTQTEAPAGELLQEVQRLQDLRARIQERAACKAPPVSPISDRKNEASCDPALFVAPLRERIHELEERLSAYESERQISKQREEELLDENYRLTEKNYCLEADLKQLRAKLDVVKLTCDAETSTHEEVEHHQSVRNDKQQDEVDGVDRVTMDDGGIPMSRCQTLYRATILNPDDDGPSKSDLAKASFDSTDAFVNPPCLDCSELWKDCDARIRNLASTEFCLRQQISSLEDRESAFFETLRQADATWAKLEADYEAKQKEMSERLTAQVELNRALFEHLTKLNKTAEEAPKVSYKALDHEPMEVDDDVAAKCKLELTRATQTDELENCRCQWTPSLSRSSSSATGVIVRADSSRTSTISRTSITMTSTGSDEIDTNALPLAPSDPLPEVATEAREEEDDQASALCESQLTSQQAEGRQHQQPQPEALISIDESSSDKKQIIYFRWR